MSAAGEDRIVELRFPARPDRMWLVRASVRDAARYCGLEARAAEQVVLAVAEACQNVMRHGYAGREDGDIVLSISLGADDLVVRVRDFAPPVDPAEVKSRDLDDVRPGGLGVHFIEQLMDSAVFLPGPEGVGNVLQMTKQVTGKVGVSP